MTNSSSRDSAAPRGADISGDAASLLSTLGRGKTLGKLTAIAVALVGTSVLHYSTPIESIILHNVYQRLYYFPIIAAAFWFGFRGAIGTSGSVPVPVEIRMA